MPSGTRPEHGAAPLNKCPITCQAKDVWSHTALQQIGVFTVSVDRERSGTRSSDVPNEPSIDAENGEPRQNPATA